MGSLEKQKDHGLTGLMATYQFIRLLGTKHRDFRDIQEDQVCTSHLGTYEIYNAVRKRMQPIDEKPVQNTPTPAKPKAASPKKATPESGKQPLGAPKVLSTTARVEHTDGVIRDVTLFKGDPHLTKDLHPSPTPSATPESPKTHMAI